MSTPTKSQLSPISNMSTTTSHSPDVSMASGELSYPHRWIGSTNPIHEQAHVVTPQTTSQQHFLQYYGFHTTPVAIYQMNFEDGPKVKGQPKMFHAQFTHPHDGSTIVIDGKVYTHKAFSNQQAAYQKDRYGMCMVSPTLCYTLHGVVDNEKKRVERIARELRLDGEAKCAKKKRRQVFKINDSAVMMRRAGYEADYPTYAFNTNATYTIAFYSRHGSDHVTHTGVRYTHCEHDVFVHINASHGGEIALSEPNQPVIIPSRKRKPVVSTTKKRRHSELSEPPSSVQAPVSPILPPLSPISAHQPPVHTPVSPTSTPSSPDTPNDITEFPISHVSESSFDSQKRARVDEIPYDIYGYGTSHPLLTGPSLPPLPVLCTGPSLPPLPPLSGAFPMSSPLLDFPLLDPIDPLLGDMIPDTTPSLSSGLSYAPWDMSLVPEETWLL